MPAHFVALSDLHLGYDNSLLNGPAAQANLAAVVADLCGGATDKLILNGDVFEGCVPSSAGQVDSHGYSPAVATAARGFFSALLAKVKVGKLVILWGNHDYAMWKRLAASCGVPTFTNNTKGDVLLADGGAILPGAEGFLADVIGPAAAEISKIVSAYPNHVLGDGWPYIVFHHGHFLDDLVLGQNAEAEYAGLALLTGVGRPKVSLTDVKSVADLHDATEAFVAATWAFNSKAREKEWAMIRRFGSNPKCSFYPTTPAPASSLVPPTEVQQPALGKHLGWYTDLLTADPTTPAPVGDTDAPSYLFLGHDHAGGFTDVPGLDSLTWKLVNTGGWTNDAGSTAVHGHVTVWGENDDGPTVHCARV